MQVVYERCCGLDVHKATVVACVLTPAGKQLRTFGTMTGELLELGDWLLSEQVTMVAMESTGVYWKPIYNLLEGAGLALMVVNARHMKAVPGRKTDVKDAEWHPEGARDLLRHGLLRASFIPDRAQRELAELVRYRRSLIEERVREANRIQKVLEGANIKLASVISFRGSELCSWDPLRMLGVSGRAMLEAIVAGAEDPAELAAAHRSRLHASPERLEAALRGSVGPHQRLLLELQLRHVDQLSEEIAALDTAIDERLRPFGDAVERLDTIPGVGRRTAQEIIATIGTDMSRFPTARHLASWAQLCPGTNESAGKHRPAGIGKGNATLRAALVEAAQAIGRSKTETYLKAQYQRLARRRGKKRALVAVAHSILVIAYALLRDGTRYTDLGPTYFDRRDQEQIIKRTVERLERLNLKVTVEPAA